MRASRLISLAMTGAVAGIATTATTASAVLAPPGKPSVEVRYDDAGGIHSTTTIPGGSVFWSSSSSGAGVVAACTYYLPGTLAPVESHTWLYLEAPAPVGPGDPLYVGVPPISGVTMLTSYGDSDLAAAIASFGRGPIATGTRRFRQLCMAEDGSGLSNLRAIIDVPATDPFWGLTRNAIDLRNDIQLEPLKVITIPDKSVLGGLVVNFPTSLQIVKTPWYQHQTVNRVVKGWNTSLLVSPYWLEYDVTFTPNSGGPTEHHTISCLRGYRLPPQFDTAMPERDRANIPGFVAPGDTLDAPCTWVPRQLGTATIIARTRYLVTYYVSGYTEPEPPYTWQSAPFTIPVGQARIVNVNNPGA